MIKLTQSLWDSGSRIDKKALMHAKRWSVYNSEKEALVKGGYLVEVADKDRKKVI